MPEIPPQALAAAERAIIEAATDFGHDDIVSGPSCDLARAALEAAAPVLAEAVAKKILAHRDGCTDRSRPADAEARRRALTVAAAVAGLAFSTEDGARSARSST